MSTLIHASNFKVVNLRGVEIPFKSENGSGYIPMDGFGIWDIAAGGYVAMGNVVEGSLLPYSLRRKRDAKDACKDGLFEGYKIVKTSYVVV